MTPPPVPREPEWAADLAAEIRRRRPGPHVVATGVSPSGPIHIGNLREVLIADTVARALRERGERARLLYVADTYDPLRKVYPFLPDSYEAHVGRPLAHIPDPEGCCPSYAEHFLRGLAVLSDLGVTEDGDRPVEPIRTDRLYREGRYGEAIRTALDRRDDIARTIGEVSGREVPPEWSPFLPICERCGRLDRTVVTGHDATHAAYRCRCGHSGRAPYAGGGKLGWRVDWPARWRLLGVTVEPFGKDIGAAGGSYDTGVRIAREAFGYAPPFPIYFEHILLKGAGKLSKSAGRTLTARELLDIMTPETLRALLMQTTPRKAIHLDLGLELVNRMDQDPRGPCPFSHMVTVVQMVPEGDDEGVKTILKRSGFGDSTKVPDASIAKWAGYARNWLRNYAPPEVKFRVQETLPSEARNLRPDVKRSLAMLASLMEQKPSAEAIHNGIYEIAGAVGAHPKELFRALYLAFLGQPSGPRAGWFLQSLDPAFVRRRLEEASR